MLHAWPGSYEHSCHARLLMPTTDQCGLGSEEKVSAVEMRNNPGTESTAIAHT